MRPILLSLLLAGVCTAAPATVDGQKKVLQAKGFTEPPDLTQYGLVLDKSGLYRVADFAKRAPAGDEELARALDALQADKARRARAAAWLREDLKRRLPSEEAAKRIDALPDAALPALWEAYVKSPPENMMPGQSVEFLKGLGDSLKDAKDDAKILDIISGGFDAGRRAHPVAGPERWDVWRGFPGEPGTDPTPLVKTPPRGPPTPLETSLRSHDSNEAWNMFDGRGGYSGKADPEMRQVLFGMAADPHAEIRDRALEMLSQAVGNALDPLMIGMLSDPDRAVRDRAIESLSDSLNKRRYGGGDNSGAAHLAEVIALSPGGTAPYGEASRSVLHWMSDLNRLDERDKARVLDELHDPQAILAMIGTSAGDVSEFAGLHTDTAKLMLKKAKQLSGGAGLGEMISDPRLDPMARSRIVARLNRYNLLSDELNADPQLFARIPGLLLGTSPSKDVLAWTGLPEEPQGLVWVQKMKQHLGADEIFSVGRLAWRARGPAFGAAYMKELDEMPSWQKPTGLMFALMNRDRFNADQRALLLAEAARTIPPEELARANGFGSAPPFYKSWPRGLRAAIVFTQDYSAQEFLAHMARQGYSSEGRGASRVLRKQVAGHPLRIDITILPSNNHGWVNDRNKSTSLIKGFMGDKDHQVVVYRGHAGDYREEEVGEVKAEDKVFFDLGCDSVRRLESAGKGCSHCAFFGTTTTAEGQYNTPFLRVALESLAARRDFGAMERMFEDAFPKSIHKFTGSWSSATALAGSQTLDPLSMNVDERWVETNLQK